MAADGEPGHTAGGVVVPEAATVPLVPLVGAVAPDEGVPDEAPDDVPAVATTDPAAAVPELVPVLAAAVPDEGAVPDDAVPVPAPVPVLAIVPDTAVDDPVLEDEPEDEPLIATCVPLLDAQPW